MRTRLGIALLLLCALPPGLGDPPRVTVYRSGGAWIEREVDTRAASPGSLVTVELPATLVVESLGASAQGAALPSLAVSPPSPGDPVSLAEACAGQEIALLPAGETGGLDTASRVRLVAAGDRLALVELPDGSAAWVAPERIACHPPRLSARYSMEAKLPAAAPDVALRYRTTDWAWSALHVLVLSDSASTARLHTRARVRTGHDADLAGAHLRLVAGDVPQTRSAMPERSRRSSTDKYGAVASAPPASESSSEDLILFDLEEPLVRADGRELLVALRPAARIEFEDLLVATAPAPSRGGDDERRLVPRRVLRFVPGGERALPAGLLTVSSSEGPRRALQIGTVAVPRTAPTETAEVRLGEMRDVIVRWQRRELSAVSGLYRQRARVVLRIENPRKEPVSVELRQDMGGAFELLESSVEPARRGGTSLTYRRSLDAGEAAEIRFEALVDRRRR